MRISQKVFLKQEHLISMINLARENRNEIKVEFLSECQASGKEGKGGKIKGMLSIKL
jgi:hypothetical protein